MHSIFHITGINDKSKLMTLQQSPKGWPERAIISNLSQMPILPNHYFSTASPKRF